MEEEDVFSLSQQLYHACYFGDAETVEKLLKHELIDVNRIDCENGHTHLEVACYRGYVEVVKLLLGDARIDVNIIDPSGHLALNRACHFEHREVVRLLLADDRVDVNKENDYKQTPYRVSLGCDDIEIFKMFFLHKRVDVRRKNDQNGLMVFCCIQNKVEHLKWLLSRAEQDHQVPEISSGYSDDLSSSGYSDEINALLKRYHDNPLQTKTDLRIELGIADVDAGLLMAMVIQGRYMGSFFRIVDVLPLEMKMKIINMVYGMNKDFISQKDIDDGLAIVKTWK